MERIYFQDTLQGKKVLFEPRTPGEVSMYVCGLTTSNDSHVGHARTAIVFDLIRRIFRRNGYTVHYISNFTDIDDKIIQRSNEEGIPATELAEKYIQHYLDVIHQMHISEPDMYPKVTDHIPAIVESVATLIKNGFAYESSGDVYFHVRSSKEYGKLSKKNLDDLISGARVQPGDQKRDPLDFALWKKAKPGEPSWDSPWGKGRPGWHIECSVMALQYLGNHFDIHGGGQDLIFPHHENEIAQAEGITCSAPFCRYWIHTGWVTLDKQKMSKSIGNVLRIKDALQEYHPNVLRYFFLATLYNSSLECNDEAIERAEKNIERITITLQRFEESNLGDSFLTEEKDLISSFSSFEKEFHAVLRDNFNTPEAFSVIHLACRELNRYLDQHSEVSNGTKKEIQRILSDFFDTLGFYQLDQGSSQRNVPELLHTIQLLAKDLSLEINPEFSLEESIACFIQRRMEARMKKNFAQADLIRDRLQAIGVLLEDSIKGTSFRLEKI